MTSKLFDKPVVDRPHSIAREGGSGVQKIYRFKNNYGASVVRFRLSPMYGSLGYGSYTDNEDEWELAVVYFPTSKDTEFEIVYDTPVTSDVLGHLTEEQVEDTLSLIKELPERKK